MKVEVRIPWKPKVKSRPRMTKTGHTYTDKATVEAEAAIADAYRQQVAVGPFEGPVHMEVEFFNEEIALTLTDHPDYLERKLRGDLDNYVKLVSDALNGVAYTDDKQIVAITARKG